MFDETSHDDGDDGSEGRNPFDMRMGYAILHGHDVVRVADSLTWGRWFETAERHVASTHINAHTWVSTVFLGLDHGFGSKSLWFESMTFRKGDGREQERYATWDEAEAGHAAMVAAERRALWGYVRVIPYNEPTRVVLRRARILGVCDDGDVHTSEGYFAPGNVYRNRRRVPFRAATFARRFSC